MYLEIIIIGGRMKEKIIQSIKIYQTVVGMWNYRIVYNDDKVIDTNASSDYETYDDLLTGLEEYIVYHYEMRQ